MLSRLQRSPLPWPRVSSRCGGATAWAENAAKFEVCNVLRNIDFINPSVAVLCQETVSTTCEALHLSRIVTRKRSSTNPVRDAWASMPKMRKLLAGACPQLC